MNYTREQVLDNLNMVIETAKKSKIVLRKHRCEAEANDLMEFQQILNVQRIYFLAHREYSPLELISAMRLCAWCSEQIAKRTEKAKRKAFRQIMAFKTIEKLR